MFLWKYILEDFENTSPYFCTTQIWYESFVNVTARSRDAADDVTWVHTASSIFPHSQLKLSDYF